MSADLCIPILVHCTVLQIHALQDGIFPNFFMMASIISCILRFLARMACSCFRWASTTALVVALCALGLTALGTTAQVGAVVLSEIVN